jgi:Flp pilus assembly protein TadG
VKISGNWCLARRESMNMGIIRKLLGNDSASEVAEAALVLPLAFMVLLGIYWFGRAFNTYATINDAAREGARVAVVQTCGSCGNQPPTPIATTVDTVVTQTMQASSVDPGQIKSPAYVPAGLKFCSGTQSANCSASSHNINVCTNVQLQNAPTGTTGLGAPACGVAVTFQYPYQFWLPFTSLNNQQLILTADVQMAGEY